MTGAGKNAAGRGRGQRRGATSGLPLQQAAYDGPSETRGRSPSQSGTPSRSQSVARASSVAQTRSGSRLIRGYDPRTGRAPVLLRNVDFGGEAYNIKSSVSPSICLLFTCSTPLGLLHSPFWTVTERSEVL